MLTARSTGPAFAFVKDPVIGPHGAADIFYRKNRGTATVTLNPRHNLQPTWATFIIHAAPNVTLPSARGVGQEAQRRLRETSASVFSPFRITSVARIVGSLCRQ